MRIGNAVAVALSLAALANAAQFGAVAPTAVPEASTADDGEVSLPPPPPPPILAAVGGTRRPSAEHARAPHSARAADADSGPAPEADENGFDAPPAPLWDTTTRQIVAMTSALRRFKDDDALKYIELSDEAYERERRSAELRIGAAEGRGDSVGASEARLPSRAPPCVDAWVEVDASLAARSADRRCLLATDEDSARSGPEWKAVVVELERRRIQCERRRAARGYKFEVTRLRPDLLREYAEYRERRRTVSTLEEVLEFAALSDAWKVRWADWCNAEADSPNDQRTVEELVRSIPSRLVDDSTFVLSTSIPDVEIDAEVPER